MTFDRINRKFEIRGKKNKTKSFHTKAVHLALKKYDRKTEETKKADSPQKEKIYCDLCELYCEASSKNTDDDMCYKCYEDYEQFLSFL